MKFLNTALYSRLSAATAVTSLVSYLKDGGTTPAIISMQAPEGQSLPYAVYSVQGGGDTNDTSNRLKNLVVFVRAYASTNARAGSIDAAIDTALHLVPFTGVSGWTNIWLAREQDFETVENPPTGSQVFMNGGLYRMIYDAT